MITPLQKAPDQKIMLENLRRPSDLELEEMGTTLGDFYKWRNLRTGPFKQFQDTNFDDVLSKSRELFWNALETPSDDLEALGIQFSLPYVRKEVLEFVGKLVAQNYKGRFNGDGVDIFGVKVLQGIYDKWRFKNNDKVEKFWEILYGVVNGTVCNFIGYNNGKMIHRYLREYDKKTGDYRIEEKEEPYWNDVWSEIVPIEDMYVPKVYERHFQRQGRAIWKTEMTWKDFKLQFKDYDNAEYVYPGNQIAEDSLYYRMLSGTGVMAGDKVQIIKKYVWQGEKDKYLIEANGVWLNPIGKGRKQKTSPMPWNHKMAPFSWGIFSPIDEKLAYGLPLPFLIKEPHKILNISSVMLLENELRNISPAILSSDFDAPKIIYGTHEVTQVNDVEAYKEFKLSEPSSAFFNMMGNMKSEMSETAQGGSQPINASKQPKSSREVLEMQSLKQQAMGIALLMYYDVLRQQMMLVIKTALQYYPTDKYKKQQGNILRAMHVPNSSLTGGGVGNLHIRITKTKPKDQKKRNLELFFESINMSLLNGRATQILEAPASVIQNLEFEITDIDLEPEQSDALKKATYIDQVINPMMKWYVPSGMADVGKVFLRHLEMMGEHPIDFASEKAFSQLMATWQDETSFKMPEEPKKGGQAGNLGQIDTGTQFGGHNASPMPLTPNG